MRASGDLIQRKLFTVACDSLGRLRFPILYAPTLDYPLALQRVGANSRTRPVFSRLNRCERL